MIKHLITCDFKTCKEVVEQDSINLLTGWLVVTEHEDNSNSILIYPLTKTEFDEALQTESLIKQEYIPAKYFCCLSHAIFYLDTRINEIKNILAPSEDEKCLITEAEIGYNTDQLPT